MSKIKILLDYETKDGEISSPTDPNFSFHWTGLDSDKYVEPLPPEVIHRKDKPSVVDSIVQLKESGFSAEDILAFGKEGLL